MARPKGSPKTPGSGRKKGVPNRVNLERTQRLSESGELPLPVMLDAMRFFHDAAKAERAKSRPDKDVVRELLELAASHAKDAAPYCHQKLAAVQHSGPGGGPIQAAEFNIDLSDASDDELAALEKLYTRLARSSGHSAGSDQSGADQAQG
jgi:hypothetical protein